MWGVSVVPQGASSNRLMSELVSIYGPLVGGDRPASAGVKRTLGVLVCETPVMDCQISWLRGVEKLAFFHTERA